MNYLILQVSNNHILHINYSVLTHFSKNKCNKKEAIRYNLNISIKGIFKKN